MLKKLYLLLFSGVLLSCNSDPVTPDLGLDYYPLATGNYWIYDVTETVYVDRIATSEVYQQRESFVDVIENGKNTTYILKVERRTDESERWISSSQISIRQASNYILFQEDNQATTRLTFPIKFCEEDDLGNLNAENGGVCSEWQATFNSDNPEFYHYRALSDDDFRIDESDHIKLVLGDFPANLVKRDQRYEIFAKGIGLVDRSYDQVDFCFSNDCGGSEVIQDGRILSQRLIEYGSE